MKLIDLVLLAVILLLVLLAIRSVLRHDREVCSGNCSGCNGCATKGGCDSSHEASAGCRTKAGKAIRQTETKTDEQKKGETK